MASASSDSDYLKATIETVFEHCPRFRILVVGRAGVGKSSLINRTFNVDVASVSHFSPGKASVDMEITSPSNPRFVLHDSKGYEYGDVEKLYQLEEFITRRCDMPELADKVHAVWLCIQIPAAGARLLEAGDERLLELCKQKSLPVVIVFTKYDRFAASQEYELLDSLPDLEQMSEEEVEAKIQQGAKETVDEICAKEFKHILKLPEMPPYVNASIRSKYHATLAELVKITQEHIIETRKDPEGITLHSSGSTEATIAPYTSILWATAQRVDPETKIQASVAVGRAKYWRGLASSIHFPGKSLKACLRALHTDIVMVWNFCDIKEILLGEAFQARISQLTADLVEHEPNNPNVHAAAGLGGVGTVAGIVAAVSGPAVPIVVPIVAAAVFAFWVYEVYSETPRIVCCLMAYIVDLTNMMQSLFWLAQDRPLELSITQELLDLAFKAYEASPVKSHVHRDIRFFMKDVNFFHVVQRDKILDKVVGLINDHRFRPEQRFIDEASELTRKENQQCD